MKSPKEDNEDQNSLELTDNAIPCGLMAKTYFNDSFCDWKIKGNPIDVNEKNIAFEKDKELYKNVNLSK